MNTSASVCICVPAIVYALYIRFSAARRRMFFERFQKFLYKFEISSRATQAQCAEIILKITGTGDCPGMNFAKKACEKLPSGIDFESAWNLSVEENCSFLSETDKVFVKGFVSAVNASDPVSQVRAMKIYIDETETKLKSLADYEKKDMKAKCAVIVFAGCAAALAVL